MKSFIRNSCLKVSVWYQVINIENIAETSSRENDE